MIQLVKHGKYLLLYVLIYHKVEMSKVHGRHEVC